MEIKTPQVSEEWELNVRIILQNKLNFLNLSPSERVKVVDVLEKLLSGKKLLWQSSAVARVKGDCVKVLEELEVPCLGNPEMLLGIEDRARNRTLEVAKTKIQNLK